MTVNWVKHLLSNNLEEIVSKSLLDCHVKGLHSIMLVDKPEQRIRLYIAMPDSPLSENTDDRQMVLGFHAHHCNLTLDVVRGRLYNWVVAERYHGTMSLRQFKYQSPIDKKDAPAVFVETPEDIELRFGSIGYYTGTFTEGQAIFLPARAIHTVRTFKGELSAWLVYEGKEDAGYEPFTYSNHDISQVDITGLYNKPSSRQVLNLLGKVWPELVTYSTVGPL